MHSSSLTHPLTHPSSQPHTRPSPQSATALLRADHAQMDVLFSQYGKSRSSSEKRKLIDTICKALKVHAAIEEEIFYPAFQKAVNDHEQVPEANVEHDTLRYLMGKLEKGTSGSEEFDAQVKVLEEYVKHHVKEEHNEMFPQAETSSMDLQQLGARMTRRKAELMQKVH